MDNVVSPSSNPVGPLLEADELFCHQIMDSFACVGTTDRDWTEKVCAMAMARDGSLQLGFGLGKYPNRNVMDCYAGISRGKEQITVRASRYHGDWRAKLHTDGERIEDCTTFENTRRLHQIRDTVIRIHDPVGGGSGWGNWQPIIIGEHRRSGLKAADSFW